MADLPRLDGAITADDAAHPIGDNTAGPASLVLVSRRHLRSLNSWMHNVEGLVSGKPRCTLQMQPQDAAQRGLQPGDLAEVRSASGSVQLPTELTDNIRPGVVCLPHGWGHGGPGTRTSVSAQHAGVNINLLSPATLVDQASGNAVLNGIPVTVAKVAGAPTSPR